MKCTVFRSGVDGTAVRRELLALDARTPRRGAGPLEDLQSPSRSGAPDKIRTYDLRIRKPGEGLVSTLAHTV